MGGRPREEQVFGAKQESSFGHIKPEMLKTQSAPGPGIQGKTTCQQAEDEWPGQWVGTRSVWSWDKMHAEEQHGPLGQYRREALQDEGRDVAFGNLAIRSPWYTQQSRGSVWAPGKAGLSARCRRPTRRRGPQPSSTSSSPLK